MTTYHLTKNKTTTIFNHLKKSTMKQLAFTAALILFSFPAFSQDHDTKPLKIADETTLQENTNGKKVKIITSNETISKQLIDRYAECACINYSFRYKKDRNGNYPEWVIYLPIEKKEEIIKAYK